MIDAYLKQDAELEDHAIHLLFAVNRWEKAQVALHSPPRCLSLSLSYMLIVQERHPRPA